MVATLEDALVLATPKEREGRRRWPFWVAGAVAIVPLLIGLSQGAVYGLVTLLVLGSLLASVGIGWLVLSQVTSKLRGVAQGLTARTRWLIGASREFVADAEAARITRHPSALVSALEKVRGRSRITGLHSFAEAMMIDGLAPDTAGAGEAATHPSINERLVAIREVAGAAFTDAPRRDTRARGVVRGGTGAAFVATEPKREESPVAELLPDWLRRRRWLMRALLVLVLPIVGSIASVLLSFG